MTDVLDKLRDMRTVDGSIIYVEVLEETVNEAVAEITRLRSTIEQMRAVSGLAIEGKPFSEIKKEVRNG